MSTTTLKTLAPTGRTIAKAFTRNTDALATNGNATSLTYGSTNTNLLTIVWTDLADGDYDLLLTNSAGSVSVDVLRVSGVTSILLGDRTTAELDPAVETQIDNIENASGYLLAVLAGACADPQTASETYAITVFGSTFTVDMAGQTSTGTRTAPTLTKS